MRTVGSIIAVVAKLLCFVLDRALYLEKNDPQAAEAVLKRLRGTDDVGDELKLLRDEQEANEHVKHLSIKQVVRTCFIALKRFNKVPYVVNQRFL